MTEIKIAAYLFPDFEKQHAGNISFGAQKWIQWHFSLARKDFPPDCFFRKINKLWLERQINWRFHRFSIRRVAADNDQTK